MSPSPSDNPRMVVPGDARQRTARLALAAGDQQQDVVVRDVVDVVLGQERRQGLQIAALAGRRVHVAQRPADNGHAAPRVLRRQRHRFHPRDVAGEAGDRDAAAQVADQRGQAAAHVQLAAGMALDHRIGRIADHRQHALVAERGQRGLIRRRPQQRRRHPVSSRRCAAPCRQACRSPAPAPRGSSAPGG